MSRLCNLQSECSYVSKSFRFCEALTGMRMGPCRSRTWRACTASSSCTSVLRLCRQLVLSSADWIVCGAVQKQDLARMYRLFNRVEKGLVPVADTFKRHVEAQGLALTKAVSDAMEASKAKDAGTALGL